MKCKIQILKKVILIHLLLPFWIFSQNQQKFKRYFDNSNGVGGYVEITTQPVNYSGAYVMVRQDKVVITDVKTDKGYYSWSSYGLDEYKLPYECRNCFFYTNGSVRMNVLHEGGNSGRYYGKFNTSATVNGGGNLGASSHDVIFSSEYTLKYADEERRRTGVDPWTTRGVVTDIEISEVKGQGINELLSAIRNYERENQDKSSSHSNSESNSSSSRKSDSSSSDKSVSSSSKDNSKSDYHKTLERNANTRNEVDALMASGNYARARQVMESNPNLFSSQEKLDASVGQASYMAVSSFVAMGDAADSGYISLNYYTAQLTLVGVDIAMKFNLEDSPAALGVLFGYTGSPLGDIIDKNQSYILNQFEIGDEEFRPDAIKAKTNVFKLGFILGANDNKFRVFNEITPFVSYTLLSNYQVCVSGCNDDDDFITVKGQGLNFGVEIRLLKFLKFGALFQKDLKLEDSDGQDFFVGPDENRAFSRMGFDTLSPFENQTYLFAGLVIPL